MLAMGAATARKDNAFVFGPAVDNYVGETSKDAAQ